MANLFEKIFVGDSDTRRIAVHVFGAILRDYMEGHTTAQQALTFLEIDPVEDAQAVTELQYILGQINACSDVGPKNNYVAEVNDILLIADAHAPPRRITKYYTSATFNARIQAIVVR